MISIQSSLTELERTHQIRQAVIDSYVAAIDNIAHYTVELDEKLTVPHRKYLTALAQEVAAGTPEAGGLACFGLEPLVEIAAVPGQPREVLGGAQLTDEARGVPRGAAGDVATLQQEHVAPAELREVIGDATAGDTTADHDHSGVSRRERGGHEPRYGPSSRGVGMLRGGNSR